MKYILTISFLFSFAFAQQRMILGIKRDTSCVGISGIAFCGKISVFMGNSIVRGRLPVDLGNQRWTTVFCTAKNAIEDNKGIDGQTMNNGCGFAIFDPSTIPTYNASTHAALFIALGENDIGFNSNTGTYTPATFKTAYTTAVLAAIAKGWPANRIILVNAYQPFSWNTYIGACSVVVAADATRANTYNAKIAEVASENGCILRDVYTAMNGLNASYFAADGLHPNALGDAVIANFLISTL